MEPQHAAVAELGQPRLDRFVEPQPAVFHQDHRRGRGDGLGDRGDAEDGVAPHGRRIVERQRAELLHVDVVIAADERDEPGHLLAFDVAGQDSAHPLEPGFRKAIHGGHHDAGPRG